MNLTELENLWASQLRGASMIFQIEYEDQDAVEAMRKIGQLYKANNVSGVDALFPASLLVGINQVASKEYDSGKLWEFIFLALDELSDTLGNRTKISNSFQKALDKFQLERFEHPTKSMIGEMLLHSGIPVNSLDQFAHKLMNELRSNSNLSGAEFNDLVREIAESEVQGKSLNKPTYWFVKQAGALADDFVERCISLYHSVKDSKEYFDLGLPQRIAERLASIASEELKRKNSKFATQKTSSIPRPSLKWHEIETENELRLVLPEVPDGDIRKILWRLDGKSKFDNLTSFKPLPGSSAATNYFVVHEPQTSLSLFAAYNEGDVEKTQTWNLNLYKFEDWLLFFDHHGNLIPSSSSLHAGVYTVLYPAAIENLTTELTFDSQTQVAEIEPPIGWLQPTEEVGWSALRVDLDGVNKIELVTHKGNDVKAHSKRRVSTFRKPQFETEGAVVKGVFDEFRAPVLSKLPLVELPQLKDESDSWSVTLKDKSKQVVWESTLNPGQDSELWDPNSVIEVKLDGFYEFEVKSRALGWSERQEYSIVTGLTVECDPFERHLLADGSGLERCEVNLWVENFDEKYKLSSDQASFQVNQPGLSKMSLTVMPKHESIELFNKSSGNRSIWIRPALCHIEDLKNIELTVQGITETNHRVVGSWPGQAGLTHELFSKSKSKRLTFQLAELVDDAKAGGAFIVQLIRLGKTVTIANIFRKKLHDSHLFNPQNGILEVSFNEPTVPENLKIAFLPKYAPWLEPLVSDVESTSILVPDEVRSLGDFSVSLARSFPHAPVDFDSKRDFEGNTFFVECDPLELTPKSSDQTLASWFRSGEIPPADFSFPLGLAWRFVLDERVFSSEVNRQSVKDFASKHLQSDSSKALTSYPANSDLASNYVRDFFLAGMLDAAPNYFEAALEDYIHKPLLLAFNLGPDPDLNTLNKLSRVVINDWGLRVEAKPEEVQPDFDLEKSLLDKSREFLSYVIKMPTGPMVHPYFANDDEFENFSLRHQMPAGRFFEDGTLVGIFRQIKQDEMDIVPFLETKLVDEVTQYVLDLEVDMPERYRTLVSSRPALTPEQASVLTENKGLAKYSVNIPAISIRISGLARLSARRHELARVHWNNLKDFYKRMSIKSASLIEHDLVISEIYFALGGPNGTD